MKLTPPTKSTFSLSLLLAALAILSSYLEIPIASDNALWVLAAGYLLLVIGVIFNRL